MKSRQAPQTTTASAEVLPQQAAVQSEQQQLGNAEVQARMGQGEEQEAPAPGLNAERPAAGALDRTRPTGAAVDATIRGNLIAKVKASAASEKLWNEVVRMRGDENVPLKWSDKGSYHQAGSISLDRHKSEAELWGTIVHELQHLHTYLSGKSGNVRKDSRDSYVSKSMEDEYKAVAKGYVAQLQQGERKVGQAGHAEFVAYLKKNHDDLLGADLMGGKGAGFFERMFGSKDRRAKTDWAAVEKVAYNWAKEQFASGKWAPSTSSMKGQTYMDYYGSFWDSIHP